MPALSTEPGESAIFKRGRHRAFIKIQDGCRYRCTFCIVTVARGEEKSRPIREIIDEINALHRQNIDDVTTFKAHNLVFIFGYKVFQFLIRIKMWFLAIPASITIARNQLIILQARILMMDFLQFVTNASQ